MVEQFRDSCFQSFLVATEDVLGQILEEPPEKGRIIKVDGTTVDLLEVAVILGLTGELEGRVVFEFKMQTALNIVKVMNFGEEFATLDSMAKATLSEFGNLVAGRAVTICNDNGAHLTISPPMLMCGMGVRTTDQNPVQKICVGTHCGDVVVNISWRASQKRPMPKSPALQSVAT